MSQPLPRHIAVIMDGNGRWAQRRGLGREEGHRAGADAVRRLVTECRKLAIPYVTVYAFSKENWGRPEREVRYLFDLFVEFVSKEVPELVERGIRLDILGDKADIPFTARQALEWGVKRTETGKDMLLSLALSYSGREEILRAVRELLKEDMTPEDVTEEALRRHFYNPDLPDPDLVIRTSGELRISNFLLFESAYSEYYFTETHWPDFDAEELHKALESYRGRKRRFGQTNEQREQAENPETRAGGFRS